MAWVAHIGFLTHPRSHLTILPKWWLLYQSNRVSGKCFFFLLQRIFLRPKGEKSLPHLATGVSHFPTGLMEKHQFENQKFCALTYPPLSPFIIQRAGGKREGDLLSLSGQEGNLASLLCLNRSAPGWTNERRMERDGGTEGAVCPHLACVSHGGRGTWKVTKTGCLSGSPPQGEPPAGWGSAAPSARTIASCKALSGHRLLSSNIVSSERPFPSGSYAPGQEYSFS